MASTASKNILVPITQRFFSLGMNLRLGTSDRLIIIGRSESHVQRLSRPPSTIVVRHGHKVYSHYRYGGMMAAYQVTFFSVGGWQMAFGMCLFLH